MSENNAGAEFLQKKYQLNTDSGVKSTAKHIEARRKKAQLENKPVEQAIPEGDYSSRIENYLNRLHVIVNPEELGENRNFNRKERNLAMIKHALHGQFVTTPDSIPESYYDSIKRRHREEGHGNIEIPEDYRLELAQTIIKDQEQSLDLWVDYLASDDAKYPDWLKYFAFRSVLGMGNYDKQKAAFNERTKGGKTVAPFPELNREALAIVLGDLEKKYPSETANSDQSKSQFEFTSRFDIPDEARQKYWRALENKNFSQLYALAIEEYKPIAEELLKNTEGEWVKYPRGSDPKKLVASIANYGTGWCLRGEAIAQRYLVRDQNDLHVFYSFDKAGNPTVPRVVMVINKKNQIAEVRGVSKQEHLDSYIGNVVDAKLSEPEFAKEGVAWKKKSMDMRRLTAIEQSLKTGRSLDASDLVFLYEINSGIEGFGYEKDPRVKELLSQRNSQEDMLIVFGCSLDEIARSVSEIKADTKAYVGPLAPGIFYTIGKYNVEHVYTSFPEGKIRRESIEIGGKSKNRLEQELQQANINVSEDAKDMLHSKDFTTLPTPETLDTVILNVADLGLPNNPATDQVYAKAKELGLELVPAETGVRYGLKAISLLNRDQLSESLFMSMEPIADRYGNMHVFWLDRRDNGVYLDNHWVEPSSQVPFRAPEFLFALRPPAALEHSSGGQGKSEPKKLGLLNRFLKR